MNIIPNGGVAQLGEHLPCKQGVKSSNLSVSITVQGKRLHGGLYLENFIQMQQRESAAVRKKDI